MNLSTGTCDGGDSNFQHIFRELERQNISLDTVQIREYNDSDFDNTLWQASDDVHEGKPLDLHKTRQARAEEMGFVKTLHRNLRNFCNYYL